MGLMDYFPKRDDEREKPVVIARQGVEPVIGGEGLDTGLADVAALGYKEGRELPMEVVPAKVEPVKEREKAVKPEGLPEEDYRAALSVFPRSGFMSCMPVSMRNRQSLFTSSCTGRSGVSRKN